MGFIDSIFSLFWDISDYFYNAYSEVKGWVWPFSYLQYPLYALYRAFWSLLTPIAQFGDWASDVSTKVSNILSQVDILSLLRTWLTYAENAWSWVLNAWTNVTGIIGNWWDATKLTVQGWIDIAKQALQSLIDTISESLASLQAAWDTFKGKIPSLDEVILWWGSWWANILKPLNAWWNDRLKEVDKLIDSALKRWFPFYDDLVKLWDSIKLFFTDPEEWLYKAVDRIIERFW